MNEVLNFLKECKVFFVSTVDGNEPKVRPFSFVMEYEGKLCFSTNSEKPIYAQLKANPNVEISGVNKGKWIRLSGEAVFCTTKDNKIKALELEPILKKMCPNEEIFEIFYLDKAVATLCSLSGDNKTINL